MVGRLRNRDRAALASWPASQTRARETCAHVYGQSYPVRRYRLTVGSFLISGRSVVGRYCGLLGNLARKHRGLRHETVIPGFVVKLELTLVDELNQVGP